jgi:hypothetical protein
MVVCIDSEHFIKVFREHETDGKPRRVRLGVVHKAKFDIRPAPGVTISEEEMEELQAIVDTYRSAIESQKRTDALRFPEIARSVVEYYNNSASDIERQLISNALRETMRAMRKANRDVPVKEAE